MSERQYGMSRGRVFPAEQARSLLNPLRRLVQSPARSVAAIDVAAAARVLELGCGPGFFTPHLAGRVPAGFLLAMDLQPDMLTIARERVARHTHVHVACGDAMDLPLATGSLDAAFVATMLGEVPDPGACIAEVRRVLADGGSLSIAETRRDSDFIPLDALRQLVEAHRFTFVGRRGPRWQYVAQFRAT